MTDLEKWEFVSSIPLRVSYEQSKSILREVEHRAFAKAMESHWVRQDGNNVTCQSKLWLLSWAQDERSPKTQRSCQQAWDAIFGIDNGFGAVTIVDDAFPRKYRYSARGPINL